jgi:hypothetical protein
MPAFRHLLQALGKVISATITDINEIFVLSGQLLHMSHHDLMGHSKDLLQRCLLTLKMSYIILCRQSWQYPFDAINFKAQAVEFVI